MPTPVRVSLRLKSNAKLVAQGQEKLRRETPEIGRKRMYEAAMEIKRRMSRPGRKVKYPINWDSVRQKLYILIKYRGKLPYKRTGRTAKSLKIVALKTGYAVQSTRRGYKYIHGDIRGERQSSIHVGRQKIFRKEADAVTKALPKKVRESLVRLVKTMQKKTPV